MNISGYRITVKKRIQFMQEMINFYLGDAFISFEGTFSQKMFEAFPNSSNQPTAILNRNTTWPLQSFIIFSLEANSVEKIKNNVLHSIGIRKNVKHILISKNGKRAVSIHDWFDPDGTWVRIDFPESKLLKLIESRVIESFEHVNW